jgi:universal stress protein A
MQTLKTILHATDFSDLAANAFHAAFALARAHNARLILLYVKQPQESIQGEFGLSLPEPEEADADILDRLAELLPEGSPVQVERLVAYGMTAEVIVQVAKEQHCDLIVLGTHGRKGLARLFYGNVADQVTRSAPCPVLALRSSQTEADEPAPKRL